MIVGVFAEGGVGCACGLVYGVVCVRLGGNILYPKGGAAVAGAVQHLTSLRTLE